MEKIPFLPFNKGYLNGKGNPPVEGDVRTHYLWTETLARHSFMEIFARYMHLSVESKKLKLRMVFDISKKKP